MEAKKDRNGKSVTNGSRVKWVGREVKFTHKDHQDGYKDVSSGARGNIVNINHRSGKNMVLVKFDGHKKPVSLGLGGIEKI